MTESPSLSSQTKATAVSGCMLNALSTRFCNRFFNNDTKFQELQKSSSFLKSSIVSERVLSDRLLQVRLILVRLLLRLFRTLSACPLTIWRCALSLIPLGVALEGHVMDKVGPDNVNQSGQSSRMVRPRFRLQMCLLKSVV